MNEYVTLVDRADKEIGTEEKIKAHLEGKLHRAFSIFIFNSEGELLLQKRANHKYHSGGLWSNTCCSHPRPNESLETAATRRLNEEMGLNCPLEQFFSFIYKAEFSNGLIEHELDHVFMGHCNANPLINEEEVEEYKWISVDDLQKDLTENPERYTPWLKIAFKKLLGHQVFKRKYLNTL